MVDGGWLMVNGSREVKMGKCGRDAVRGYAQVGNAQQRNAAQRSQFQFPQSTRRCSAII